jgi:hypothetical protein
VLNCRTRSSDISGYHTDFYEGNGTVGEWQGHGTARVNWPYLTWEGSRRTYRMAGTGVNRMAQDNGSNGVKYVPRVEQQCCSGMLAPIYQHYVMLCPRRP